MRILILSTKLPYPPRDGGAIATLGLAVGLAESGIDVTMLTFNTCKHYFPPEKIPDNPGRMIDFHCLKKDTSIRPFKALVNLLFSRQPYIAERFISKRFISKLKELLETGDYSIIQLEGPYLSYCIPVIRKHSNAKISFRAHNVEHEIWYRKWKNENRIPLRLYFRNLAKRIKRLEKALVSQADLLVPISDRDATVLLAGNKKVKSITVPAGIDISAYPVNDPPADKSHICFIGALDWTPNQEGLLWFIREVLPHLFSKDPSIELHIAGRNAPESFTRKLAHPAIRFHGEVEDAGKFMKSFRVMAVPLLSGSGIRIKILEGMARGMCVVTTQIGAEGISATSGRDILIENNGKLFAESLLKACNDEAMSASISAAARKLVIEKFDTFAVAARLADFYKKK